MNAEAMRAMMLIMGITASTDHCILQLDQTCYTPNILFRLSLLSNSSPPPSDMNFLFLYQQLTDRPSELY